MRARKRWRYRSPNWLIMRRMKAMGLACAVTVFNGTAGAIEHGLHLGMEIGYLLAAGQRARCVSRHKLEVTFGHPHDPFKCISDQCRVDTVQLTTSAWRWARRQGL